MRFSGALLLWTAFTLAGIKVSLLLKKREDVISETLLMLNMFISEIEYSRKDIMSIIGSLSEESYVKNLTYIFTCNSIFASTGDFIDAWSKALDNFSYYRKEEKIRMLQFGKQIGTSDCKTQIDIIRLYCGYFENFKKQTESEYEKYGKISSLFGMFIGAAVFILLF